MSEAGAPWVVCFSVTTTVYAKSHAEAQTKAWEIANRSITDQSELDINLEYADEIPLLGADADVANSDSD